jgi:Raf kinase inhibitor-like YbhB/YbcL family protein
VRRLVVLAVLVLGGCGGGGGSTSTHASATSAASTTTTVASSSATASAGSSSLHPVTLARGFRLSSPAFHNNGAIPTRYTCSGAGEPIPLRWSGVPKSARELVLVMRDPDAPGSPFTHWTLAGISPQTHSAPANAIAGRNSTGSNGYTPPCPPHGSRAHHYVITLSALSEASGLRLGFDPNQLRSAAVGIATLVGTYRRH